jgi:hypothetical protein
MVQIEKTTEIAHDLLMIQQERMLFYEQVAKLFNKDDDIYKSILSLAKQCRDFILELRPHADLRSADPADFSDIRGEIYHRWQLQGLTPGCQPSDMICTCEENEKAITNAYKRALVEENSIGRNLRQLFSRQLNRILESLALLQSHKKPSVPEPVSKEKKFCVMWTTRV